MTRPRVGIVGAGQLGRMLALAGYPLGIDCTVLDTSADAPGAQVAASVVGALDDGTALAQLAANVDVVTLEIENVAVAALEALTRLVPVFPPPRAVAAAQDRLAEKTLLVLLRPLVVDLLTATGAAPAEARAALPPLA